ATAWAKVRCCTSGSSEFLFGVNFKFLIWKLDIASAATTSDLAPLLRCVVFLGEVADRGTPTVAPASNFTRNNTAKASRWATNAGSRTARRHGDACNTH